MSLTREFWPKAKHLNGQTGKFISHYSKNRVEIQKIIQNFHLKEVKLKKVHSFCSKLIKSIATGIEPGITVWEASALLVATPTQYIMLKNYCIMSKLLIECLAKIVSSYPLYHLWPLCNVFIWGGVLFGRTYYSREAL